MTPRNRIASPSLRTAALLLVTGTLLGTTALPAWAQEPAEMTRETIELWMVELYNHGRWGADDALQCGACAPRSSLNRS